jgi:hypothetical protein
MKVIEQSNYAADRARYEQLVRQQSPHEAADVMRVIDDLAEWSFGRSFQSARIPKQRPTVEFRDRTKRFPVWSAWCSKQSGPDIWIGGHAIDVDGAFFQELSRRVDALAPSGTRPKQLLGVPVPWLYDRSSFAEVKRLLVLVERHFSGLDE